jgi:anaerobic magnesium-protoporphyrin IX monomethyl ester cyclase
MGIKVLMIYPNTYGMNMLPTALALFSALLKNRGHKVALFDSTYYSIDYGIDSDGTKMDNLNVVPYDMSSRGIKLRTTNWSDDIKKQVKEFGPDLIAISSTEDMWNLGVKLLDSVEDYITRNKTPVLVGGVFATFAPQIVIRHPLIEMVCIGEGENALIDLANRIENGQAYDDVTNLWVKKANGTIVKNSMSKAVDVNKNPIVDVSEFEDARHYRPMAGNVYKMLPVETIRGCPYQCSFCNSPNQIELYKENAGGGYFRKKRADLIYRELKHFKETFGVEYNYFVADTFLAQSPREFDEFCELYEDIRLPFWIQTRPETLTDYNVKRLKEIGCHRIAFGLEHGNEAYRKKHLRRDFKNEDIIEKLKLPKKYEIPFSVNNITGFPYETYELAMDTIELNRIIDADNSNIYSFVPFHGSALRTVSEMLGLVHKDQTVVSAMDEPMFSLPGYSIEQMNGLKRCFALYVKFPKSRWKDIARAEPDNAQGNSIFEELKQEYLEKYMPDANADPRPEIHNTADLEYGVATP